MKKYILLSLLFWGGVGLLWGQDINPSNDCIYNAQDITALVRQVAVDKKPFGCATTLANYSDAVVPTYDHLLPTDPTNCTGNGVLNRRDVWFKFTTPSTALNAWIDAYSTNEQSTYNFALSLYSGTPTGDCGRDEPDEGISGLTFIGCSDRSGGTADARDKSDATSSYLPRLDISGLQPNTTYYVRAYQTASGNIDINGFQAGHQIGVCVEQSAIIFPATDRCPTNPQSVGCLQAGQNKNFSATYLHQSNVGSFGNTSQNRTDEPMLPASGASFVSVGCINPLETVVPQQNISINNSVFYSFRVIGVPRNNCMPEVELRFNNVVYGGAINRGIQIFLLKDGCAGNAGNNALMAYNTIDNANPSCFSMKYQFSAATNSEVNTLYVMIDGNYCSIAEYDLTVNVNYPTANCTSPAPSSCQQLAALPLEMGNLSVKNMNQKRLVRWQTLSEQNIHAFDIERSTDGIAFQKIGTQKAIGESQTVQNYQFLDTDFLENAFLYYRLKIIENDFSESYSNVVALQNEGTKVSANRLYPNPVAQNGAFSWLIEKVGREENALVQIFDTNGKMIMTENRNLTTGDNVLSFDTPNWGSGVYFLRLKTSGETIEQKLVID